MPRGIGLQNAFGLSSLQEGLRQRVLDQIAEQERQRKAAMDAQEMDLRRQQFEQQAKYQNELMAQNAETRAANIEKTRLAGAEKTAEDTLGVGDVVGPQAKASIANTPYADLVKTQGPTLPASDVLNRPTLSVRGRMVPSSAGNEQPQDWWSGTPKQREGEEQKTVRGRLIASLPAGSRERLALEYEQGTGKNPPAGMFDPKPSTQLYQVGPEGRYTSAEDAVGKPAYHPPQAPSAVIVQGPDGPQLVNKRTGVAEPVKDSGGENLGQAPTQQQRNTKAQYAKARPILGAISDLSERINTGQGVAAKAKGEVERQKAKINLNDDVAEYESMISGFTPLIARALGHTGVLTEQDVQSVKALFPRPGDSKSLRDRKVARIEQLMGAIESGAPVKQPDAPQEFDYVPGKGLVPRKP